MNVLSSLVFVWAIATTGFTAVMLYRSYLTQHETDQLFLSESADTSGEREHNALLRRVRQLRPLVTGFGGAAALMTVAVIGTVLVQDLPYVKF